MSSYTSLPPQSPPSYHVSHVPGVPKDLDLDEPSFNLRQPSTWYIAFKRKNLPITILVIVYIAITIVFAVLHDKIVKDLQPVANWMKDHSGGFMIPVAIIAVLSIPPLIGHEIIAILVGVTWGLWIGWGITCAGTFIGELVTFFMSKYLFRKRTAALTTKSVFLATLAHILSTHSWKVIIAVRYSFIPAHLSTALFASLGMTLTTFVLTAIPVFPKLLLPVSIGVMLDPNQNTSSRKLHTIILIVSIGLNVAGFVYVRRLISQAEPEVKEMLRQRRAIAVHKISAGASVEDNTSSYPPYGGNGTMQGPYAPPSAPPPSHSGPHHGRVEYAV